MYLCDRNMSSSFLKGVETVNQRKCILSLEFICLISMHAFKLFRMFFIALILSAIALSMDFFLES